MYQQWVLAVVCIKISFRWLVFSQVNIIIHCDNGSGSALSAGAK